MACDSGAMETCSLRSLGLATKSILFMFYSCLPKYVFYFSSTNSEYERKQCQLAKSTKMKLLEMRWNGCDVTSLSMTHF